MIRFGQIISAMKTHTKKKTLKPVFYSMALACSPCVAPIQNSTLTCQSVVLLYLYSTDFAIPAVIIPSKKSHPNITYDGYNFGINGKNKNLWRCTASDVNKARCSAMVETKTINGFTMMRLKNPKHKCNRR